MRAAALARVAALAGAAIVAGCSSRTAVDLTIALGGDVAAHAAEIASMTLHVDGDAAPFDRTIDVSGKFGGGSETVQYIPQVTSGTLGFTVTILDASSTPLGIGGASVKLAAHESVSLTVPIGGPTGGDGDMANFGGDDMGPPDMTQACAAIQVSTLAGTGASGHVDGAGNLAQFQVAEGIMADAQGTLWVAEASYLRKVLADGTTSTLASGFGQAHRVSQSNVGDFFVADSGNDQLFRVTSTGTKTSAFAQGGITTVASNQTNGMNYVWDTQTANIQNYNGSALVHFSGNGSGFADGAAATAQFANVPDMLFDSTGVLWVVDSGNFRVRKVATDGSVTSIAGSTQGHADGTGSAAQFNALGGIAIDNAQHLIYVTDGPQIRVVTQAGAVSTLVGSTAGFVDGNGCVAKFGALKGIAYFAGSLYAVDIERIRKIVLP
jgi:hypothetical protein